ncbi:DUF4245 domain-containing protein [Pseudonocardia acaciae]|uniref:DUF4245 domain-containing protein n=1 Tax=Pseudonocardia acaciae TaxID=551276 RepID=UPI0006888442|nr:DUF4245 domain-containing protein [Pseudonocardia acaciae]
MSTQEPPPTRAKRGSALGARPRDMVLSLLILLPVVALFALFGSRCSFSPAGPTVDPSALPRVDVHAGLVRAARQVPFAVREPSVPAGWRANSVDQRKADTVRVGWVTEGGRYLRLVQSSAEEGALVAAETGGPPRAAAPIDVAGVAWVRYTGGNGEQAWVHQADGVRWMITGDGLEPEFQRLATSVAAAPPLPR